MALNYHRGGTTGIEGTFGMMLNKMNKGALDKSDVVVEDVCCGSRPKDAS